MTKIIYTVVNRPMNKAKGLTRVGWLAECGRETVPYGGFLTTSRIVKGQDRSYLASVVKNDVISDLPDTFKSRAQASFAIWRAYYADLRSDRAFERAWTEAKAEDKRRNRAKVKAFRQTPEGMEAYRLELNSKARARRAAMTPDEKQAVIDKRKAKAVRNQVADIQ